MFESDRTAELPGRKVVYLHQVLAELAQARPHEDWVSFGDTTYTYAQVWEKATQVRAGLYARGVRRHDRVALVLENSPEFLFAWFGALSLGAVGVPVNTSARGEVLDHFLRLTSPSIVVADAALVERVAASPWTSEARPAIAHVGARPDTEPVTGVPSCSFEELYDSVPVPEPVLEDTDPAAIVFTSGTTGPSKGVTFSQLYLRNFAQMGVSTFGYEATDVAYTCLPMFHANALILTAGSSLLVGCRLHVAKRFSLSRYWTDLAKSGATVTSLLGSMATLLLQQPPSEQERAHKVDRAMLVPAPTESYDQLQRRFGITPIDMYGMTDAGIPISNEWGKQLRPGSCGRVMPGYECQLVDDHGYPVDASSVGRLRVRTTRPGMISPGYWAMPEKTVESRTDLWFDTGDLLRVDEDGWYYFVDRKKDAIRRRGENVSSYEVERAFLEHPAVLEVAAYPLPSQLSEDDVALAIVARDSGSVTAEELVRFSESRLPYFYVPRYVTFMRELPKTPTQKVQKQVLIDMGVSKDTWDMEATAYRPSR